MRIFLILLLVSCIYSSVNAQQEPPPAIEPPAFPMICTVEKDCRVDVKAWQQYLENNLVLDSASIDSIAAGIHKVTVRFVINKEGRIEDVSVREDPGFGLAQRVLKVVEACPLRWEPAEQNGRPVKSYRQQSVSFVVEEEEKCGEELPAGAIL